MSELIGPELVHVGVDARSRDDLFAMMAGTLGECGRTRPSFLQGLVEREKNFPTGIPINGGVAIPHTDAEHVISDAISIATLSSPVGFREMAGTDDTEIPVDVVIMLALGGSGQHLTVLQQVIKAIQDADFMASLRASTSPDEIAALALSKLAHPSA
ncbi:Phosphoenolpyruvate-dependent sugar phosphotransferase system [Acidipropionibacterium acidipropionici ATCC 4875]|uniref:Phosphoenolpyruvate-dependent sugar phosphotransferase system n=1 Tax=Acidipropionibacterium acidipropionici (strain ATCC 4875 / DSM 20272 / JCM 6432 / NBRC 12425 / NCIMB 8070 / 4) TaxID=1171373 RepID=K7RJ76_ACIA4|nr:PTS sugar transporter subunit IIA [Acidipropionibacterium acidipropionici]AFV87944.1 Phosphoenolpyruvate-dependent sugar phosphotransferase system [Acidipropionibacterium acidipropionici ATCC 4875]